MEPDVKTTMENLIKEIREKVPFRMSFDGYCEGRCDVCPEKLMEFLDTEVSHWESRLQHGVLPGADDIESLVKDYQKVRAQLEKEGIIK
jgi:hypothetical protein